MRCPDLGCARTIWLGDARFCPLWWRPNDGEIEDSETRSEDGFEEDDSAALDE